MYYFQRWHLRLGSLGPIFSPREYPMGENPTKNGMLVEEALKACDGREQCLKINDVFVGLVSFRSRVENRWSGLTLVSLT